MNRNGCAPRGTAICGFFRNWSSGDTNWLIPDSVSEDGTAKLLLTPTNLGLLLNARIAMLHFGVIGMAEFIGQTRETLEQVAALPKNRGHLLNWYDVTTLQPLEPMYVSAVDSGNFAAALWTLKQAAMAFTAEPEEERGRTAAMAAELNGIGSRCEALVREMDFAFLYRPRKKALSLGYDLARGQLDVSHYGLLASEARIAVFTAIAKGDIPQEAWFHLGRAHVLSQGDRILVSWTGAMFEYLMPVLWMRHHPGTITEQTIRAVVRAQEAYGSQKGLPWGISESARAGYRGGEPGYAPFGIPSLALRRQGPDAHVIAPYSSFLALMANPGSALRNLRRMERKGWRGRYGFYEAVDCSGSNRQVIRWWMAHHQGMALLALCNVLYDWPLQRYFHAEPQVLATELLLHERPPASVVAEAPVVPPAVDLDAAYGSRERIPEITGALHESP
jgi:cyclic beta-1,2-glucan synthetase